MGARSGHGPSQDQDQDQEQEQDDRDWCSDWDHVFDRGFDRGLDRGPDGSVPVPAPGTAAARSGPDLGSADRPEPDADPDEPFVDFAEGLDDDPVRPQGGDRSAEGAEAGGSDGVEDALALVGRRPAPPPAGNGSSPAPAAPAPQPDRPAGASSARHRALPWPEARRLAARTGRETARRTGTDGDRVHRSPLERSLGLVLAEELPALCDLPSFDTSAMDGWAVAGPGPWTVDGDAPVLAGRADPAPLPDGTAVRIATGARVPPETTAVIRSEHAYLDRTRQLLSAGRAVIPGQDIRPRAQECRSGELLLPAGTLVTPAVLGLAAAAGYDALAVVARPTVEVLVLGDELLDKGLPHDGLIRDALGPMTGPWLRALGAEVVATHRIGDDETALHHAVTSSTADLLVTTGGTAAGPVDHVHPVLRKAGAELLVDGVAARPGHPMLLARLPGARGPRCLVGLPGNPLAAVSALLTLAAPLLRGLAGLPEPVPYTAPVRDEVSGHPRDTRLVPVVDLGAMLVPLRYNGPAMLRGIAAADGLAVVPPGGAGPGDELEVLDLPLGR
ncbi:molybdopterin molybdotransferase MoeA [Streptomyces qinzhouensis]|uniref:Molybdopterin molybdenumtransferase n=1 Tax=Streptomyces qinzhouensis TaxID=2599401 RepID=A0A5B8JBP0_9ACTN|nr:molybdopterin molybdotransferase MoeA [Streptomyces qinzhouensis]QDY77874.1 molybdopterin molybdenumtransferase MoeA [Streptomyces qinzhouensis]